MRQKGTGSELAVVRNRGLMLLNQGKKPEEVAEMLAVTSRSVYRWRQESKQPKSKKATPFIGRPRKLTEKQLKQLEKALDRGAYAFGYSGEYWTLDRITQVIWQLFEVRYHPSGVWHLMVRMGWSNQRPQRLALHRNDQAVAVWQKDEVPEIKKDSRTERHTGT